MRKNDFFFSAFCWYVLGESINFETFIMLHSHMRTVMLSLYNNFMLYANAMDSKLQAAGNCILIDSNHISTDEISMLRNCHSTQTVVAPKLYTVYGQDIQSKCELNVKFLSTFAALWTSPTQLYDYF